MAYEKQTWVTGETITASKLNHMEDGIASLDGYDIIFSETRSGLLPTLTAEGASLEELLSSGEKRGSLVHNAGLGKYYMQSIGCQQNYPTELMPKSSVVFVFFDFSKNATDTISLLSDDSFSVTYTYLSSGETETYSGTYTYSEGQYTFTLDNQPE